MKTHSVVFVLGPPGSGKGTQCAKVAATFGLTHLSAGDLLRAERAKGQSSELGKLIDTHIRNGSIVPVEVTCRLLETAMTEAGNDVGFLVDGFPRNEDNLQGWEKEMGAKTNVPFVLFISCPVEVCVSRCLSRGLTSGRTDDNEESLKKRVDTYNDSTMPIVELFKTRGLVKTIDGAREQEDVFADVAQTFQDNGFPKIH